MEDETYIYQGVEFSRQELEEKYGDRTDEAIEKHFQVKKKELQQVTSPVFTEPSETPLEGIDLKAQQSISIGKVFEEIDRIKARRERQEEYNEKVVAGGEQPTMFQYDPDMSEEEYQKMSNLLTGTGGSPKQIEEDRRLYNEQGVFRKTGAQLEREDYTPEVLNYVNENYRKATGDNRNLVFINEDDEIVYDDDAIIRLTLESDEADKWFSETVKRETQRKEKEGALGRTYEALSDATKTLLNGINIFSSEEEDNRKAFFRNLSNQASLNAQLADIEFNKSYSELTQEELNEIDKLKAKGVSENIKEGNVDAGLAMGYNSVLANAPQIGLMIASSRLRVPTPLKPIAAGLRGTKAGNVAKNVLGAARASKMANYKLPVGSALLGLSAAGQKYNQIYDNPHLTDGEKMFMAVETGVVELALEAAGAGVERRFASALRGFGRKAATDGTVKAIKSASARQLTNSLKSIPKGILTEAAEEALAGLNEVALDRIFLDKDTFNPYEILDQGIIGGAFGGGMSIAGTMLKLPSYIGSVKNSSKRAKLLRQIAEDRTLVLSGSLEEDATIDIQDRIQRNIDKVLEMDAMDAEKYSNFSEDDVLETIKLNEEISLIRDNINQENEKTNPSPERVEALKEKLIEANDKRGEIEAKYDIKTEEQVPSTEQEREAAVEAQPDTEASEAAVETGRAVQLDEETQGELDDVMRDADFTVSEQETPTRTSKTDAYADEGVQGGIINLIKTKGGELGREFAGAIERIKSTLGEGYKVVVLDDARYRDVTNTTGRGAYDTKNKVLYLNAQQVRNLDKDNVRAVYHEAIHPILTKRFGEASADFVTFKQDLVNAINRSLSEQDAATLIARLEAFEKQYGDKTTEQQAEEFMTELGAIMTSEDVELLKKSGLLNRIKELINNLLRKLGVDISLDTENEVVEFMNSLAKGVRGGVAVADIVGYDLGKEAKTLDELIDGEAGVAIGSTERTDFQESRKITIPKTDFTADIPQISLGEALEKYGVTEGDKRKRYAIITSDFTKVGYDSLNQPINGGIGFVAIKKNVDDGVGFASLEESTAKSLFTRLRNNYGDNKNVVVLVMLQSPSSTIGNHYGAKYMYRALRALKESVGEKAFRKAVSESIASDDVLKPMNKSGKTKEQVVDILAQVDVLSEEDFVNNLIFEEQLSFNFRREYGRRILHPTTITKTGKKSKRTNTVAKELGELGFDMDGFLDEYAQKEFMIQGMLDTDRSSHVVAGFQVNTANEQDAESAVEQIQSRGILHGLFDGKVPAVKGTNFYLDGLYEVKANFAKDFLEFAVPDKGTKERKRIDNYAKKKYGKVYTKLDSNDKIDVKDWATERGLTIELKPEESQRATDVARGIPAVSDRGVEIEPVMVEEAPLSESRRDEDTFLQESRAIINEQFLSEEKQVAKFRKAGVDNKQTQQAINDIGLKGVKFTKEGIEEAIQKAFDDLAARAESFVMTEDSKAITGAIMADIEAMRADGASESQVAYAKRGLEEGSPVRGEYIRKFQDAQRNEIRNWVSYLNQSDYNTSFKYLILDGVLTNNYDKKRNKYVKRDRKTLRSVTPFNAASLAELYQSDSKEMLKDYTDIQEKNAIALAKSRQVATTTEGEWIKYDGGRDVSNEDIANNASELAGLVSDTPWCTKTNAASQLRDGDFYVYATRGEDGSMIPRIAIRMEGDQVGEVRGVASEKQDLEPSMNPVAEKFLKENIPNDSGQGWLDSIEYNEKAEQLLQDINEKGLNRARMVSYFELLPDEKKYTQDYGRNGHIERLEAKIEELVKNNELASDLKGKVVISKPKYILEETAARIITNRNLEFLLGNLILPKGDSDLNIQYVSGNASVTGDVTNIKFVGGNLLVTDGNPISVEVVGGNVDAKLATTLGNLRKVGRNLSVRNIKDLGNLEEVGDMLNISDSNIKSLGNKIKSVGYLRDDSKDAALEDFGSLEKVEYIDLGSDNLIKTIQPTENNIRFIENNREAFDMAIGSIGKTRDPKYDSYYQRYLDAAELDIDEDIRSEGADRATPSDFYIQYLKDKAGEAPLQESRNFDRKTEKAMEGFAYDPKIDERINEKNKRSFTQQVKRGAMRFNWAWFDRQGDLRRKFIKAGDLISQAGLSTRYGSSASAKMLFDKFNKKIYGTLKGNKKKLLSEVIMLRRIISIYDGFDRSIEEFELEIKDLKAKKSLTKKEAVRLAEIESKLKEKKKQRDNFKNPRKLNRNSALARLDEIKQKLGDETGNDQQFFDIDNRATQFFSVMRNRLKKMLDEGLITQDEYFRLSKYEYSPRMFVDKVFDLQNGDFKKHEKRFMSYGLSENEFKRLKEGSEEDLFVDGEFLLRMVLSSTESRILANRLYKGVAKNADKYDWVLVQPRKIDELNKEIEELQEKKDKTKDERKRLAEARKERASEIREFKKSLKGFSEVGYKEGGVRKELYIKDEMMEQMENPDEKIVSSNFTEGVSYWMGAKFLRQMATGKNVMFPLSNIPMDFRHIIMFTDVFDDNKFVAQSLGELGGSFMGKLWGMSRIGKAVAGKNTKTEALLEEALEHGMGMDWLDMRTKVKFTGRLGTGIKKVGQTIFDNLQGFSEASEIAMRLAVYQKAKETALEKRKNGVGEFKDMSDTEIKMYAAHKGRTTIDFAQGGAYAKSWDKFSPYVNAKLQGGRVSFRYAVENKEKMAKKWAETSLYVGAFFGFLAQALFDWSDWDEEDKKAIPRWHILNYHILPLPDFISKVFFDDDHKHYLKIRKNPITAPLDRAAEHGGEYIYRKMKGDMTDAQIDKMHQDAKGDFITGVIDAAPFADLALGTDDEGNIELQLGVLNYMSPAIKAANQYRTNYDYFRDKTISYDKLYQPDISPELEGYNSEYVEDFYKEIGKAVGASPQRMKSSVEVITTSPSTNVLVGLTYGALNSIIGELDALSLKPMTDGAKNRMFGTANKDFLRSKPSKELSESLREYKENRFKVRKDLEKMVFRDKASVQEVKQYIGTIEDRKLVEYAENKYNKLKRKNEFHEVAIPNKSAYYTLDDYISENPELAAEYLFNEFGSLTNQELREVASYISMIRGTRSFSYPPAFMRKYRELQK